MPSREGILILSLTGLSLIIAPLALAQAPALKSSLNSLKGKELVLKTNDELFGSSSTGWDGRRIQEANITFDNGAVAINGESGWEGRYFVSDSTYFVKDVKLDKSKDRIQVKLWRRFLGLEPEVKRALGLEPEVKLNFIPASRLSRADFEQTLYTLFSDAHSEKATWNGC